MVDEIIKYNKDVSDEQIEKDVAQAVAEGKQIEIEKLNKQPTLINYMIN